MTQPSLYDRLPPFRRHSDTSRLAAVDIYPRTGTLRRKVLDFICGQGWSGATDEEMQIALGMSGNTERPRRRELEIAGFIKDSGLRRRTLSGELAVVWACAGPAAEPGPGGPAEATQTREEAGPIE